MQCVERDGGGLSLYATAVWRIYLWLCKLVEKEDLGMISTNWIKMMISTTVVIRLLRDRRLSFHVAVVGCSDDRAVLACHSRTTCLT